MNAQFVLMSASDHRAQSFGRGVWNGFKAIVLTIWNAIPFDHPHSTYQWGYLLGMVLFLAIVVAIVARR